MFYIIDQFPETFVGETLRSDYPLNEEVEDSEEIAKRNEIKKWSWLR